MNNNDFLKWFSINQFFAEFVGTLFIVFGGLMATSFAINKFKRVPFTFGIANTLVIFTAPLVAFSVILIFNNFEVVSLPIISPINIVANIVYSIQVKQTYEVFKSLPYLLLAQTLGTLLGASLYLLIFKEYPDFKVLKDPLHKQNARSSILRETLYISLFTAFIAFNRIMIFEKDLLGFFAYNLLNTSVSFVFLISAYKHGYFTTNFYVLIGHNMLLRTKKLCNVYSVTHCLSTVSSYIGFSAAWSAIILAV